MVFGFIAFNLVFFGLAWALAGSLMKYKVKAKREIKGRHIGLLAKITRVWSNLVVFNKDLASSLFKFRFGFLVRDV